jgi:TM2 domain-containing membrane protein YozV
MKDKTMAGILALFLGVFGVHRFYLGQIVLGMVYLFIPPVSVLLGIIDAMVLLSMDQDKFNEKYNRRYLEKLEKSGKKRDKKAYDDQYRRSNRDAQASAVRSSQALMSSGLKKYKGYEYEAALADFQEALGISPRDPEVHFLLASTYSLLENTDRAFFHLDKAVAFGMTDRARIKTEDGLAFLRSQDAFLQFEKNGYRLLASVGDRSGESSGAAEGMVGSDLLDQLSRLESLRNRGLLTEEEFEGQKRKLFR